MRAGTGVEGIATRGIEVGSSGQQRVPWMRCLEVGKEGILGRSHVKSDLGQDHGGLSQVPSIIRLSWCPSRAYW